MATKKYFSKLNLGAQHYSISGKNNVKAIAGIEKSSEKSSNAVYSIHYYSNVEELTRTIEANTSIGAGYDGIMGELKTSITSKSVQKKENGYWMVTANIISGEKLWKPDENSFTEIEEDLKKISPEKFYTKNGDGYIEAITYGGFLLAIGEYDSVLYQKLTDLGNRLTIKAMDKATFEKAIKFLKENKSITTLFQGKAIVEPASTITVKNFNNIDELDNIITDFSEQILSGKAKSARDYDFKPYADVLPDTSALNKAIDETAKILEGLNDPKRGTRKRINKLEQRLENYKNTHSEYKQYDISYKFLFKNQDKLHEYQKVIQDIDKDIDENKLLDNEKINKLNEIDTWLNTNKMARKFSLYHTLSYTIDQNVRSRKSPHFNRVNLNSIPNMASSDLIFIDAISKTSSDANLSNKTTKINIYRKKVRYNISLYTKDYNVPCTLEKDLNSNSKELKLTYLGVLPLTQKPVQIESDKDYIARIYSVKGKANKNSTYGGISRDPEIVVESKPNRYSQQTDETSSESLNDLPNIARFTNTEIKKSLLSILPEEERLSEDEQLATTRKPF